MRDPAAGAEVGGVDLSQPFADAVRSEIHRAFLEHSAIIFRDQDLDPATQIAFTGIFGSVVGHPLPVARDRG